MTGQPGHRIWAIWTHRFYGNPDFDPSDSGNTLYILRLVIENQTAANACASEGAEAACDAGQRQLQAEQLKTVLESAQVEAAEWNLLDVKLWHPTPLIEDLIRRAGLQDVEGIGSLLWYGAESFTEDTLEWVGNEKYAWC